MYDENDDKAITIGMVIIIIIIIMMIMITDTE